MSSSNGRLTTFEQRPRRIFGMNDSHLAMIFSGISEASICSSRRSMPNSATNLQISHWPVNEAESAKRKLSILAKPPHDRVYVKIVFKKRQLTNFDRERIERDILDKILYIHQVITR